MSGLLRWAVIGAGRFGRIHAKAITSLAGAELAAVCRRDPAKLAEFAAEFGVAKSYSDFHQLLADPDIDVVSICTHWRDHHDVAQAALLSGKHVLLEKPMAATLAECRSLLDAARSARGHFLVGHICRFDPRMSLARQAIVEGRIGKIVTMHAKRNLPLAPGSLRLDKISPLMGDGVHDADLMLWFMGRLPDRIYARNLRVEQFHYPDVGWAMLEFGPSAIGVIESNWRLPKNVPTVIDAKLEVCGTDGKMTIDCSQGGLTILDQDGIRYPDTAHWPQQYDHLVGSLANELAYFRDCVVRNQRPQVVTPLEAAQAVAVMEFAEKSAVTGLPIDVPRTFFDE